MRNSPSPPLKFNSIFDYFFIFYKYDYNDEEVEIDHIIPLSIANTEQEIINLCHYSNLQLLKKEDNRFKSNKLNWELRK